MVLPLSGGRISNETSGAVAFLIWSITFITANNSAK
jgi:hypothetical protein